MNKDEKLRTIVQPFNALDYSKIHQLVFNNDDPYPGYRPNVIESPNGDGKLDDAKRYAHVAEKYLVQDRNASRRRILNEYFDRAHDLAMNVAVGLGVPSKFWPIKKYSALRVLDYDATAITNRHVDFDLFTLMCYRNHPECFKYTNVHNNTPQSVLEKQNRMNFRITQLNSQIHFGELLELIDPEPNVDSKLWRADEHQVDASGDVHQYSIVYFAIPDHDAVLPSGETVKQWLDERLSRSRYER